MRKNSVAGPNAAAVAAAATSMRPRANTISHVDGAHVQQLMASTASANASIARMPPTHSRHPSLVGLPMHNNGIDHNTYGGMAAALGHRGMSIGLPKLETNALGNMDFTAGGLRTAPPLAIYNNHSEFDFEGMLFGPSTGSTINPQALHYDDSPQSMVLDTLSPYAFQGLPDMDMSSVQNQRHQDDTYDSFDWLTGFEHNLSFSNAVNESAVDGSSPSAISTTSQSGISDVMLDGSNTASSTNIWQPAIMGPPQMNGHNFSLDLSGTVFPDLMNGAPISPQPPHKNNIGDAYFSTPPPSLSSVSPSIMSGTTAQQNMKQALQYGAGPETPSSMNGINIHGTTLPVSTITDSTRNAILGALSTSTSTHLGGRKLFTASNTNSSTAPNGQSASAHVATDNGSNLPSTQDLQRYVGSYLRYFHPHLPFLHLPTLSFEIPAQTSAGGRTPGIGGSGCLILSMAAIGALYEAEHQQSLELFGMAKKMIQLYLDERRNANLRKADFRRPSVTDHNQQQPTPHQQGEGAVDTPVWLVQAMLLNVVYGHNCGDKRMSEIASTHAAALVSLAQGAELLRPVRIDGSEDQAMDVGNGTGEGGQTAAEVQQHAEWLRWKAMEERKRTLYAVFILSSLLVAAYNHTPALTNSEILLDLPCDEDFFAAESSAAFHARGGVNVANHNRMTFHEALGDLLRSNEKQRRLSMSGANQPLYAPPSSLKPSTFGCLILINALHNYIWETRQRHHNKMWTNEETEKMHRHIEPALKAWQAAWSSDPHHSLERPNPFGMGPLSADAIPLLDLAYVRLFVNLSRSKELFWQRDWDAMAEELARGSDIVQHGEHPSASNAVSVKTDASDSSGNGSVFVATPATQISEPDYASVVKFEGVPITMDLGAVPQAPTRQIEPSPMLGGSISRRERHLRKAAFYAADSLAMADKLGVTFADFTSRELPIQSAMCAFDCAQVLAEWVATLQDRVGRYLGILGQDEVDPTQVPGIMLLEDDDAKLLQKIQDVLSGAEMKMSLEMAATGNVDARLPTTDHAGYAAKILRVTAYMLDKAAVWPITRLMATCLETHANHMRARAEQSVTAVQ
jgi:hypothetical protein